MERKKQSVNEWGTLATLLVVSLVFGGGTLLCNIATGIVSALTRLAIQEPILQANPIVDNRVLWGTAVALAMVTLIWLGAGVAYELARLSNAGFRLVSTLLFFIGIPCILGIVFAGPLFIGWFNSFMPAIPDWKALEPAPERAIEIVDADPSSVYVRAASGKIFGCNLYPTTKNCWREAQEPLTVSKTNRRVISVGADVNPPKNIVSSVGLSFNPVPEAGAEIYFAVLSDGSVWWWRHDGPHALVVLFGWMLPLLAALEIGLVFAPLYLGAGMFWWSRRSLTP